MSNSNNAFHAGFSIDTKGHNITVLFIISKVMEYCPLDPWDQTSVES